MAAFNNAKAGARVIEENGAISKQFTDPGSYRAELDLLRVLGNGDVGAAPRLLAHCDQTMTLRIEHAGQDLLHLLTMEGQEFSVAQIRRVLSGLLKGLVDLHSKGYCHYDVTPRNVCISGDLNSDFKVKLIDYGLSFSLNAIPRSHREQELGTRSCLSPEHLARRPDQGQAADVFCAGITALQVMAGGRNVISLEGGNLERQIRDVHQEIPTETIWGEPIPGDLNLLLRSMLAQDPTYRRSQLCLNLLGGE